jgi:hypothetical protein
MAERQAQAVVGHTGKTKLSRAQTTGFLADRSTLRFGPLNPEAEQRSIASLDSRLGYSTIETTKLIENCRKFAASVAGL